MTFNTDGDLVSFDQRELWITRRIPMPTTVKAILKKDMTVEELLVAIDNIRGLSDKMFMMMADTEIDLRDAEHKE